MIGSPRDAAPQLGLGVAQLRRDPHRAEGEVPGEVSRTACVTPRSCAPQSYRN
ncbi:hypothetical protein N599_25550 [Saccharopolyspora erythraea D]|nr:hypothetical protein N599_25550 [Saccharopolyspora erythraea D]